MGLHDPTKGRRDRRRRGGKRRGSSTSSAGFYKRASTSRSSEAGRREWRTGSAWCDEWTCTTDARIRRRRDDDPRDAGDPCGYTYMTNKPPTPPSPRPDGALRDPQFDRRDPARADRCTHFERGSRDGRRGSGSGGVSGMRRRATRTRKTYRPSTANAGGTVPDAARAIWLEGGRAGCRSAVNTVERRRTHGTQGSRGQVSSSARPDGRRAGQ